MIIHVSRSLISFAFKNPSHLHKPHKSFSFSLLYFSSTKQTQLENTVEISEYLLNRHQFSPESASKVATSVSHLQNPENSDSVLAFLKESGFSQTHLEKAVKSVPRMLSANLEKTIKPKFKIFQDLGFSSNDIADIISADPYILTRSVSNGIVPSILVLKEVLGSIEDVSKLLKISGSFLKFDLEKTMLPNFEIMKSCGICSSRLVRYVYSFPRFFLHKPESMMKFVEKVDELGIDRSSMMFLHAVRIIGSMNVKTWIQKWELFHSLGLSENEILLVFRKKPQVFAISLRKIKDATEVLLSIGKYDVSELVNHPDMLISSVEKRLRPRLQVLKILENKNLLKKWPSLSTIYKISEQTFFQKFVSPYLNEVGKVYMAK